MSQSLSSTSPIIAASSLTSNPSAPILTTSTITCPIRIALLLLRRLFSPRLFYNPYKPDYGKRMLVAQDLYANGYIHHASTFFFKDVQYFAHEVSLALAPSGMHAVPLSLVCLFSGAQSEGRNQASPDRGRST